MKETSKCHQRRLAEGEFQRYLAGSGIDIGCGNDSLKPPGGSVLPWDVGDGDAMLMAGAEDEYFDFVYSSHCLEHMVSVPTALWNWVRIVKRGGWLYLVFPDYMLYEKMTWPSRFNRDHKASFSQEFTREKIRRSNHFHVSNNLLPILHELKVRIEIVRLEDYGYDYNRGLEDQTVGDAVAQICLVAQRM